LGGSVFGCLAVLQAQLSCSEQPPTHHPDVRQRKQRVKLGGVLGQSPVADLEIAELALDHPKGMLAASADLRLEMLDSVTQSARFRFAERPPLARLHRHLPLDTTLLVGPLLDADVAGVTERHRLAAVQQLMRLRHIGDVGRRADHTVYQATLGIDLRVWCISGSRSPVLFFVELGAEMIVASTIVPCRSSRPAT